MSVEDFLQQNPDAQVETPQTQKDFSIEEFLQQNPDAQVEQPGPSAPVISPQQIDITSIGRDKEKLQEVFSNLPEGFIDLDKLHQETIKGFKQEFTGAGQFSPGKIVESTIQAFEKLGLDLSVDYKTEASNSFRFRFSLADTDEERTRLIEDEFGEGSASRDPSGRFLFLNSKTGKRTAIDSPVFNRKDIVDVAADAPEIIGIIAGAILSRGQTVPRQITAEVVGGVTGSLASEGLESFLGQNLENLPDIKKRNLQEAGLIATFSVIGRFPGVIIGRFKSPLSGGVTEQSRQISNDFRILNAERTARGLQPLNVRPSAVNESPALSRLEGILAKFPGSAGVFAKNRKLIDDAINDEIEFLTKGLADKEQIAPVIRQKLQRAMDLQIANARLSNNAKFTGVDPVTGGEATVNGTEVALQMFENSTGKRLLSITGIVTDQKIVSTRGLKNSARSLISRATREETGEVIEAFTPGITVKRIEQILRLPDQVDLQTAQNIRQSLGEIIGGRNPLAEITEGQAKFLFKGLASSMDNVNSLTRKTTLSLSDKRQFVKEYREFNKFYKEGHDDFNLSTSPFNKILKRFKDNPDGLVEFYFRKNNATNIARIKSRLPAEDFKKFQQASQDVLLSNKTGKQLDRVLDTMDDATLNVVFGKEKVTAFRQFAKAQRKVEETPIAQFLDEKSEANRIFINMIEADNPASALRAKQLLGANSSEWKQIQLAFADKLINKAIRTIDINTFDRLGRKVTTKQVSLDGQALLDAINREFGERTVSKILEGTPLLVNLRRLAVVAKANAKGEGGSAGGLASGLFMLNLFRTANFLSAGMLSAATWTAAKSLNSKTATRWLTNEPLSNLSKSSLRALTESALIISSKEAGRATSERGFALEKEGRDIFKELEDRLPAL
jgi:hypothetical protein